MSVGKGEKCSGRGNDRIPTNLKLANTARTQSIEDISLLLVSRLITVLPVRWATLFTEPTIQDSQVSIQREENAVHVQMRTY